MLEQSLPALLPSADGADKTVAKAMQYSLLNGGKRVRGTLLLAFYNLFAADARPALPFAAAVEMVHAYSLIHDDLPCMDDDDMRRGKPACHIAFGEAAALLAGDGLLTLAFETLSLPQNKLNFSAETILSAVRTLSVAAGANGMVGGQMIDLENENKKVSLETLMLTDRKKTGALIKAACLIGCALGGADAKTLASAETFAEKIGLAFQIEDDILDVTADPEGLGKPVGSDIANGKTTYASLYGTAKAAEISSRLTEEAKAELKRTGLNVEFLCSLADSLVGRKK